MSKTGDLTMTVEIDGEVQTFRFGDYTALDARAMRLATGLTIPEAFNQPDLDAVAGLIWLERSKAGEEITYEDVAAELSYDAVDFHGTGAGKGEAADPEA